MIRRLATLCAILAGLAAGSAMASEAAIRQSFQARFPNATVESVTRTPFAGIYEVVFNGQIAYTHEGGAAFPGDFKAQARGAYQAIQALVESQGGTMGNVVKLTTFVTDMKHRPDLAAVREEFFGKKGPASTLVEVSALAFPGLMVEIEAIAVL